jgi:hypothetical protein
MKIEKTFTIPAPPARVAEALCSEAYNVEEGNGRADVASTRYRPLSKTDERVEFAVDYTEYKRTKLGRIDKSGTVGASTRCTYTRATSTLEWVYSNEASTRITLRGRHRLEPEGERTRLRYEMEIDVRIPLIGDQIAKLIVKEFDTDLARTIALIERHATGR